MAVVFTDGFDNYLDPSAPIPEGGFRVYDDVVMREHRAREQQECEYIAHLLDGLIVETHGEAAIINAEVEHLHRTVRLRFEGRHFNLQVSDNLIRLCGGPEVFCREIASVYEGRRNSWLRAQMRETDPGHAHGVRVRVPDFSLTRFMAGSGPGDAPMLAGGSVFSVITRNIADASVRLPANPVAGQMLTICNEGDNSLSIYGAPDGVSPLRPHEACELIHVRDGWAATRVQGATRVMPRQRPLARGEPFSFADPIPDPTRTLELMDRFRAALAGIDDADYAARFAVATENSLKTFLDWLTPEQRKQFDRDRAFIVVGGDSGLRYRIRGTFAGYNIDCLRRNGTVDRRMCFVPTNELPIGDFLLTQKLALETDEADTWGCANFAEPAITQRVMAMAMGSLNPPVVT
jgi:hypothetical protein